MADIYTNLSKESVEDGLAGRVLEGMGHGGAGGWRAKGARCTRV